MAVNPSTFGSKPYFFDWISGVPANGYQVFFYVAGSVNTKQNTYTDSTGLTANPNPIVLDSAGQPANQIWFTAGQKYKVLLTTPTDTDPPTGGVILGDQLAGINDVTATASEWISGPAPTFISGTSFSLLGDQRQIFATNRRLQSTNTAGTIYSSILTSTYNGSITTVTVVNDSGALDTGLSAVNYALLNSTNPSIPAQYVKTDSSGDIIIANNSALEWRDSGGVARRSFLLSSSNAYFIGDVDNAGYDATIRGHSALEFDINASPVLALASTGATVTGVTNSTTGFQYNGTALPIQRESNIADQVITTAGQLTLAHGLTTVKSIEAYLVCQTGEAAYTAGQIFPTALGMFVTSGTGLSVIPDSTNLVVRFSNVATCFGAVNASTGAVVTLTNANWKLRLIARGT